jgi:hypothetical protein
METAATGALHPDIARFSHEIAGNLANFENLCSGLSEVQFNWSPEPGRWSIAQNLGHLIAVNSLDLTPITQLIADARARNITGPGPYKYPFWNNYLIRSMEPPRLAAPRRSLGEGGPSYLATGLDFKRVRTIMPALRFFKMPLGARFALLCAHDRRHLWHARNIRNHPSFPAHERT